MTPITALGSRYGIQGALGRSVKRAAAGGGSATFIAIDDESLRNHARNQGALTYLETSASAVNLLRFDLSGVSSSAELASAELILTVVSAAYQGRTRDGSLYETASANADWVEGTGTFNSNALEGEPTGYGKEADGSGGVKTYWAGGASVGVVGGVAGTDYVNTKLANDITLDDSDSAGDTYVFTLNASGLAVVESWFGQSTNGGFWFQHGTGVVLNLGSHENATESYRPRLELVYL